MNVLIAHNRHRFSAASGEDRAVDQEAQALEDAGHQVHHFERSSDRITHLSLTDKAMIPARAVWNPGSARELDGVLAALRPEVVHIHNLLPLLSPSVIASCQRNRVPCVVTFHNYHPLCLAGSLFRDGAECTSCVGRALPLPGIRHRCYRGSVLASASIGAATAVSRRYLLTVPSAYIFLSESHRRELEALGFPRSRSFVKSNLVPPGPRTRKTDDLVVYLGRLADLKGLRTLMCAWERYAGGDRAPRLRLVIAGSGPLEAEIRGWSRSQRAVDLAGLLSREDAADLVSRATTVVVPSEWREPFGLVTVEAMAAGVAPIAAAHGASEELITDGVDGLLHPPGDHAALCGLLRRADDDPEWFRRLGAAARSTYERRFTPARVVSELEDIYRFAIGSPRWLSVPMSRPTTRLPKLIVRSTRS